MTSDHEVTSTPSMTRRTWLASGGAMLAAACAGGSATTLAGSSSPLRAPSSPIDLDELPRWMRLANVPGLSVAVVERDRVTTRGFGVTRADGADAVNGD